MKRNHYSRCLNCSKRIGRSNFCPECGQMNTDSRITLAQLIRDFLGDYFTFDSKFFRSLLPLIFRPGHLTKEYVTGRRIKYILPTKLYVFTTLLFFFVLTLNQKTDQRAMDREARPDSITETDSLRLILNRYGLYEKTPVQKDLMRELDSTFTFKFKDKADSGSIKFIIGSPDSSNSKIHKYLQKKSEYITNLGSEGTVLFWKEAINQIPKVVFLLLPFFAFILKLLYIRHKIYFMEHFVFSLHMHTSVFLFLLISLFFSNEFVKLGMILIILIYLFFSIYYFYGQSLLKTILKTLLLLLFYLMGFLPAFVVLILLAFISI
jgi:hypothetical protein